MKTMKITVEDCKLDSKTGKYLWMGREETRYVLDGEDRIQFVLAILCGETTPEVCCPLSRARDCLVWCSEIMLSMQWLEVAPPKMSWVLPKCFFFNCRKGLENFTSFYRKVVIDGICVGNVVN